MKIAIDISQLAFEGTGVARYTQNLVESIVTFDNKNSYIFFFSSLRKNVPSKIKELILKRSSIRQYKLPPTLLNLLWNKWHILPIEKFVGDVDIVFTSDWTEPPVSQAKKITTIHDLAIYHYPETSHETTEIDIKKMQISANIVSIQKRKLDLVKKESDLIICDSQSTKNDAREFLDIPDQKLRVVYPAVNLPTRESSPISNGMPFILTVGTLQPRKNLKRLIEAFKKAHLSEVDLYIAGAKGWGEQLPLSPDDNVKFLGYVEDGKLAKLYENALFFIYPSLYEGFGYPVVEAMAHGCPVATSNSSSLREIAEEYSLLFDPNSVESIRDALIKLYKDEKLRKSLINKGLRRAEDFTLRRFAQQLFTIFDEVYGYRS